MIRTELVHQSHHLKIIMKMISMMIKNMLMTFKSMAKVHQPVHQRHHEDLFNDDQEHVDVIQEHGEGTSAGTSASS